MSVCRPCVVRQESVCRPCKVRRVSVIWPLQVRIPSGKGHVPTKVQEVWTRFTMPFGGYSPAALHRLPTSWGAKVCPFSGVCPHPSRNENMLRTKSRPWRPKT